MVRPARQRLWETGVRSGPFWDSPSVHHPDTAPATLEQETHVQPIFGLLRGAQDAGVALRVGDRKGKGRRQAARREWGYFPLHLDVVGQLHGAVLSLVSQVDAVQVLWREQGSAPSNPVRKRTTKTPNAGGSASLLTGSDPA